MDTARDVLFFFISNSSSMINSPISTELEYISDFILVVLILKELGFLIFTVVEKNRFSSVCSINSNSSIAIKSNGFIKLVHDNKLTAIRNSIKYFPPIV